MILSRYHEHFSSLPGYFANENAAIWDALLSFQEERAITGSLLEIGVFRGKSAGMLALHTGEDEKLVLIDSDDCLKAAERTLRKECSGSVLALHQSSIGSATSTWVESEEADYRWIHIDGDHTAAGVRSDLKTAERLLSDEGIICLDDFFSPMYPQITMAACDFVKEHHGKVAIFLAGWNKAYLCRPAAAKKLYLPFIRDELVDCLSRREIKKFTLYKTDYPDLYNCFGIGLIFPGRRLKGLDSDPDCLPI